MSVKGDLIKRGIGGDGESIDLFKSNASVKLNGTKQLDQPSGNGAVTTGLKRSVSVIAAEVDASGGGSAQTTAIGTIPAGAILLGVICEVTETFNGDTTQTIEVGVGGNIDKYIDSADINPGSGTPQISNYDSTTADQNAPEYLAADTAVIATWTNTASVTEGTAVVRLFFIET